ncbi:MAG: LysR family transcriptional regulator [Erysipelotrichales bacterium]|nr:LysR family transcriptional regulator [Erysipelotrichales bacterium]
MYKSNTNFNLYKTFYDVAICGSISKAANINFTSQPAISRSIKTLEDELNTKLFVRTKKGIELTEKGKELFFYVEQGYNSFITAERSILEDKSLSKGKLSIGIPSHIATFYLFNAIDEFHKKYPGIEITIISKSTSALLELLRSHEIDFMIDSEPVKFLDKNISIKHIKYLHNAFIASSTFDTSNIKSLKDLENTPVIIPIKGTANRTALDEFLALNNIELNNVLNIHTSELIQGAIKRNLGVGYIIKELVADEIKKGNLKEIKFDNLPKTGISLVYIRDFVTETPKIFLSEYYNIEI